MRHQTSGSVNQTLGRLANPRRESGAVAGVVGRPQVTPTNAGHAYDDGTRRTEILQTAASLIATSGLRTSLQEIADAAGILPGSLYHHFESKEAILVELLRRYHADLDRIAEQCAEPLGRARPRVPPSNGSSDLECGDRAVRGDASAPRCRCRSTRARVRTRNSPNWRSSARRRSWRRCCRPCGPPVERLHQVRRRPSRACRPDLSKRCCRSDSTSSGTTPATDKVATLLCRILLEGLAADAAHRRRARPVRGFIAADEVDRELGRRPKPTPNDKAAHVRAVARAEFGRRGYEVTTIRDIASAAGLGHRHGVSVDRLERRTAGLDHAVVRREGRRRDGRTSFAPIRRRSRSWTR